MRLVERSEELRGGEVVGADEAVRTRLAKHAFHLGAIGRVDSADVRGEPGVVQRLLVAADARVDRGRRAWTSDKGHAATALLEEMRRQHVAGSPVIDADEVVVAAGGVRHEIAIEEDDRDAGPIEDVRDTPIDRVLLGRELERCEEDPRDFPGHQLTARLRGLLLDIGPVGERRAPEQDVLAAVLRVCHAAADRFEDFRASQLGDQQAEDVPVRTRVGAHVAARSGTAIDETDELKLAQRPVHGRPRRTEGLHQFGLTREPRAGLVLAARDLVGQGLPDSCVFGLRGCRGHDPDNTGCACGVDISGRRWYRSASPCPAFALAASAAAVFILVAGAGAQGPPPAVRSPDVHGDRRVTFRLRAPEAARVDLVGEVLQGKGPQVMTKDADGVWSITIGPLPPEIWIYNFRIEGVDLPDPANISQMPRAAGTAISSFVEVPGDVAAFYDARPVPHGDVRMVLYESKAMGVNRYLWVYTPPNYDTSRDRYPVYYLLHGNGETQSGWVANGRANLILDNLIAAGNAAPMIVVMPHGHPIQSASVGPPVVVPPYGGDPGMLNFTLFTRDLLDQIIPLVDRRYRVYTDPAHRAIGGLSMGGFQSLEIGLAHPELFGYVLAYSGGFGSLGPQPPAAPIETQAPWVQLLANPSATTKRLQLLFLGCGQQETGMLAPGQRLVRLLQERGINAHWSDYPGRHVFSVWRNLLHESVPLLFRPRSGRGESR